MIESSATSVTSVYWTASTRSHGFRGHLEAANAGGFEAVSVPTEDYFSSLKIGLSPADIKSMAAAAGTRLFCLDSITDWTPIRYPPGSNEMIRQRFDVSSDDALMICDQLGLTTILAVAGFEKGQVEFNQMTDGFGRLCDKAARAGLRVELEFMPFWGVPTLRDAWNIVRAVGAKNSGIVVDTWHLSKGELDWGGLHSIPGEFLSGIQVSDGVYRQIGRSLLDDTLTCREFPGEGEFPIRQVMHLLLSRADIRHVGPEVFSLSADTMSAREIGERCAKAMRNVMQDRARPT